MMSSLAARDSAKLQQVRSQCPAVSNCSMCPRGRDRGRARRETKKGSAGVAARRHPTRRHPKHFAEPSGGRRWTLRAHDPDIWLYLACAEEHRSRCGRSPITGHTTPSSHGSAAPSTQMQPDDTPACRPLAWRGAAPGGYLACATQDGAARAHIRHLADNNLHTGVSDRARSDRIILPRVAGLLILRSQSLILRSFGQSSTN